MLPRGSTPSRGRRDGPPVADATAPTATPVPDRASSRSPAAVNTHDPISTALQAHRASSRSPATVNTHDPEVADVIAVDDDTLA